MKRAILLGLFWVCVLIIGSCDDNPITPEYKMTAVQFPNEVGLNWLYYQYDSINHHAETVFVAIIDSTDLGALTGLTVWEYQHRHYAETLFVQRLGDTITFYDYNAPTFSIDFRLVFPLEIGSTWSTGTGGNDSCEVTAFEAVNLFYSPISSIPASPRAFRIDRQASGTDDFLWQSYWLMPNAGFMKFTEKTLVWATETNISWQICDFSFTDPFVFDQFPLELGNNWVYERYDSVLQTNDTIRVSIVDSVRSYFPPVELEDWKFEGLELPTQMHTSFSYNSLLIYWPEPFIWMQLDFPLFVGKKWYYPNMYDTIRVTGVTSISTPYQNFSETYTIEGELPSFNARAKFKIYLAKDVGIVRFELLENELNEPWRVTRSWQLIDHYQMALRPDFKAGQFPIETEAYWNYTVFDNLTDSVYPLRTEFVGGSIHQNKYFYNLRYTALGDTSIEYLIQTNDTLFYSRNPDIESFFFKGIVFPFNVGDGWRIDPFSDSSTVLDYETVYTIYGERLDAFKVETWMWCGDECGHIETDWYVPNIGLVKKNIHEEEYDYINGGFIVNRDETWVLSGYYLPIIVIDCTQFEGSNRIMNR